MSPRAKLLHRVMALSRPGKRLIFLVVDMVLAVVVFAVVTAPTPGLISLQATLVLLVVACMGAAASRAVGLPRIKLNAYGRHALLATAKYATLVTLGMIALCQVARIAIEPAGAAEIGLALFLGCIASRYAMLTLLQWILRQGAVRRRVLIYGAGDTGVQMALALRHHQHIVPVAFLDDDVHLQSVTVAGLPVVSPQRLEAALSDLAAYRVLLAMPSASNARLAQITKMLQALGLEVQVMPSFAKLVGTDTAAQPAAPEMHAQLLGRSELADDTPAVGTVLAGRVVLVSGAGGSVGSELCRQLIAHRPRRLILYERCELALYTIEREMRDLAGAHDVDIVPILGSIIDARFARNTMIETGTEIVFHAAAYKHVPLVEANPVAGLANNVIGTHVFADAAISASVDQFVLISTDKAVRPRSVMGATKRLAELVIQDLAKRSARTRFSTVRFGNVLGSSGSVLPLFRDQIARGGPVTLTHDDVTRYFMTLAEAAQLVLLSTAFRHRPALGDSFVLDMGQPIRIRDLAERMILAKGLSVKSADNPSGDIEIVVTGLRQGEKLHEDLSVGGKLLPTSHPKIRRDQDTGLPHFAVASALKAARDAVRTGDQRAARAVLADWVDGFPRIDDTSFNREATVTVWYAIPLAVPQMARM